jgi:hypothetical protein
MGFALTVLYIAVYYLTPAAVFGPLAALHVEQILAALVIIVSLPELSKTYLGKTPQTLAVIGLALAVFMSVLIGVRWPGGAVQAVMAFAPCAFAYFLLCLHCNSKKKLQFLIAMMLFICIFFVAKGSIDLSHAASSGGPPLLEDGAVNTGLWNLEHPYLIPQNSCTNDCIYRIRGLGEVNDPNDFAQVLVCVVPLAFIFWRPKNALRNFFCVILPVCVLLYGTYLTHSRGALLALVAISIVAMRRRIGTVPALLLAGGLFFAAMALNFTGGREISTDSGIDRMQLWGEALQLMKSHPLFGVGLGYMPDHIGLTAHNTIAVCVAELGLFGFYFWSLFLFSTMKNALTLSSPEKVSEGEQIVAEPGRTIHATKTIETVSNTEINTLGRLLVLSLTGFLVAGWFLSRAYVMTFFLIGGMVEVAFELALRRGMVAPRMRLARVLGYGALTAVALLLLMYILLRVSNMTR